MKPEISSTYADVIRSITEVSRRLSDVQIVKKLRADDLVEVMPKKDTTALAEVIAQALRDRSSISTRQPKIVFELRDPVTEDKFILEDIKLALNLSQGTVKKRAIHEVNDGSRVGTFLIPTKIQAPNAIQEDTRLWVEHVMA